MAVRVLPRVQARRAEHAPALPAAVLVLSLVPAALDLLRLVQPALGQALALPSALAAAAAAAVLVLMWVRWVRAAWLAAASFAACASLGLRLVGADVAPLLSVLSILALGVGGAFASQAEPHAEPRSAV